MPLTELKRWSTTVTKDKSASDSAQIPGGSLTIDAYDQGASVSAAQTITAGGGTAAVSVYDIGELAVNSTVQVGTDSAKNLTVTVITNGTTITCRNDGVSSIVLAQYDRLVITSSRPVLYRDVTGTASLSASGQTTTNSRGFVEFYISNRFFDYIITDGSSLTLVKDEESGQTRLRRHTYNVKDFPTVALALSSIPAGARLYCPADEGPYVAPDANGWTISKAVEIFSDQGVTEDKGFKYFNSAAAANTNDVIFTINGGLSDIYLHDVSLSNNSGTPAAGGTGDAIRFSAGTITTNVFFERVNIFYAGRSGIRFTGAAYIVKFSMRDSRIYGCRGDGAYLNLANQATLTGNTFTVNKGAGLRYIDSDSGVFISGCDFANNGDDLTGTDFDGQLVIENCHGVSVMGNNIEDFSATTVKNGIVVNAGDSVVIGGNQFDIPSAVSGTRSIQLYNTARNCTVLSNAHSLVDIAVNMNATTETGCVIFPQHAKATAANGECALSIPADTKSILFVTDQTEGTGVNNNKTVGIGFPGLAGVGTGEVGTTALRAGLLVFDTTANKFKFYTGAAWETITSA
jgi:hypothetical protein